MEKKTITVTALGISGPEWITRLEKKKYRISDLAKQLLNSPEYENHRLKKGKKIQVALVKYTDTGLSYPTTKELQAYATAQGYGIPTAEFGLLLREKLSDDEIKALGAWYISVLHEPIKDSGGDPGVLCPDRHGAGRWVHAYWDRPDRRWGGDGVSAFPVSASKSSNTKSLSSDLVPLTLKINGHTYKRI